MERALAETAKDLQTVERILALENEIHESQKEAAPFLLVERRDDSSLIISAPHAVHHMRDGQPKSADFLTGPLALVLAERLQAAAIIATASSGDPNWDPDSPYRRALTELVRQHPSAVVLDLHGADDDYGFGVALGSAGWERRWPLTPLQRGQARMEAQLGESVWLNGPFFQAGSRTLTAYVVDVCGRPAVQVEIARRLRRPVRHPGGVLKLMAAVELLCEELLRPGEV